MVDILQHYFKSDKTTFKFSNEENHDSFFYNIRKLCYFLYENPRLKELLVCESDFYYHLLIMSKSSKR